MPPLKRPKVDRDQFRTQVIPQEIRGLITHSERSSHLPFLVWDVSENGVGIWTSENLPLGCTVRIAIGQPYLMTVECVVVWCEEQSHSQGFRCGLRGTKRDSSFKKFLDTLIQS